MPEDAARSTLRVTLLSREYPPNVYGGAGVHVEHLARELSTLAAVEVRSFGPRAPTSSTERVPQDIAGARAPAVRWFEPSLFSCS